jgi:hypothetical protein
LVRRLRINFSPGAGDRPVKTKEIMEKEKDIAQTEQEREEIWNACKDFARSLKMRPDETEVLRVYLRQVEEKCNMVDVIIYAHDKIEDKDGARPLVELVARKKEDFEWGYLATLMSFHVAFECSRK